MHFSHVKCQKLEIVTGTTFNKGKSQKLNRVPSAAASFGVPKPSAKSLDIMGKVITK